MHLPRTTQTDRERYPNGRAKPIEGPTPETAKKHQERAQRYHIPAHMEAGYAESTMGVLFARGMIGVEQYELCKKLANLRSVLYGSGNARCSSIENVGRGLPNDRETKSMRDTWAAYKTATAGMEQADRRLFEHVILRNNYREWMSLVDGALFHRVEIDRAKTGTLAMAQAALAAAQESDNSFVTSEGRVSILATRRELALILRVIHTLGERMPRETRNVGKDGKLHTGAISDAQANALYGGESKLDELYMAKARRDDRDG